MKALRWLGWILGGLVVLIIVLVIVLNVALPKDRIRAEIVDRVEEATGYEIALGDVSLGLGWRGLALHADDIVLSNPQAGAHARFLELKRLDLGVSLWPLLKRQVEVRRLVLREPRIELWQSPAGELNAVVAAPGEPTAGEAAPPPAEGGAGAAGLALAVPEARIEDGGLRFTNAATGASYGVDDLDANLRVGLAASDIALAGDLDVTGIVARPDSEAPAFGPLGLRLDFDLGFEPEADRLSVRSCELRLAALALDVTGAVSSVSSEPMLDLELATEAFEPAQLLSLVPQGVPEELSLAGTASIRATVQGVATDPDVTGRLALNQIAITAPGVRGPVVDGVDGEVRFTRTELDVPALSGRLAGGEFRLAAKVTEIPDAKVDAKLKLAADLADVASRLPMPPEVALRGGKLDVDLSTRVAAADPLATLRASGTIDVTQLGLKAPGLGPEIHDGNVRVELAGRAAVLEPLALRVGRSDLSGNARVKDFGNPEVVFALTSKLLDLDELVPAAAGGQGGEKPTAKGPATGTSASKAPAEKAPPLPGARGTVQVTELHYRGLTASDVRLRAQIDEQGVRVDDVHGLMLGGTLTGSAAATPAGDSLRYQSELKIESMQANELLTATTPVDNLIYGTMDADVDLAGLQAPGADPLALLTANANGSVTNGYIQAKGALAEILQKVGVQEDRIQFDQFISKLVIRDGRVILDNGKMLSGKHGEFHIGGSVGFDGTLGVEVQSRLPSRYLPKEISGNPQVTQYLADDQGRVPLSFSVGGTIERPQVTLDLGTLQQELQNRLQQEATKRVTDEATEKAGDLLKGILGGKKSNE